jgi:hypothetical protein
MAAAVDEDFPRAVPADQVHALLDVLVQFHAPATIRDMSLLIAMPAPWLPAPEAGGGAAAMQLPELPAFSRMLRQGRPGPAASDWRAGVFWHLSGGCASPAPVALAARALPALADGTPLCMAAPVHVVAGISRVHLPPGGRLRLDALEEQAWCAAFNQEFGAHGVQLHIAAPGGGWLLQAAFAGGARDDGPDALAGEVLARQPARDGNERLLRRLSAEVEMWLAAHALNREREARRQPVLNAIWFWDGGSAGAVPPLPGVTQVATNIGGDAWLAGLARHAGATAPFVAARWNDIADTWRRDPGAAAGHGLIVLVPESGIADAGFWRMVEEQWLAPVAAEFPQHAGMKVLLQVGPRAWSLPHRSLLRWIRPRPRAWWQMAGVVRP